MHAGARANFFIKRLKTKTSPSPLITWPITQSGSSAVSIPPVVLEHRYRHRSRTVSVPLDGPLSGWWPSYQMHTCEPCTSSIRTHMHPHPLTALHRVPGPTQGRSPYPRQLLQAHTLCTRDSSFRHTRYAPATAPSGIHVMHLRLQHLLVHLLSILIFYFRIENYNSTLRAPSGQRRLRAPSGQRLRAPRGQRRRR